MSEDELDFYDKWFDRQGFDLFFEELAPGWGAVAIPKGTRVGSAPSEYGGTKVEAATALKQALEGQLPAIADEGTNVATSSQTMTEVVVRVVGALAPKVELPQEARDRLEKAALDFCWIVAFTKEPD